MKEPAWKHLQDFLEGTRKEFIDKIVYPKHRVVNGLTVIDDGDANFGRGAVHGLNQMLELENYINTVIESEKDNG